jgi:hypothetical protein
MDPASAAGLGLAAASAAFQVFSGCIVGFQLLSTAQNLGHDAEFLVCMLRLEEYRLILWAKQSGLADDDLDRRLDEKIIQTTLAELKELLLDTAKLKDDYKLDVRDADLDACPVRPRDLSSASLQFLNNSDVKAEQERILRRASTEKHKNRWPKRLWWAAVDRQGFEKLIVRIGTLVQTLFELLSIAAKEETRESLHLIRLSLLSIAEKVEDVRIATRDIPTTLGHDQTLETVAALRRLQIDLSDDGHVVSAVDKPPTIYRQLLRDVTDVGGNGVGQTAMYEGVAVYLERKKYTAADIDGARAVQISKRVEELSKFLHVPKAPSFQSLHCAGHFQNALSSEFVFIFDRPFGSSDNVVPLSLLSLLKSKQIPSLTDRFKLANGLATTLLHLHASGWLHKGIRSENVLLFPKSVEELRTLHEPYLVGYEYARQDKPGELSDKPSQNPAQDIYRHPRAQGLISDSFVKAFDIYSLGIMLVEVAYWRPFASLLRDKLGVKMQDVSAIKMQEVRDKLLAEGKCDSDDYPQNLRFRMGDGYAKATLQCLGTFFEDDTMSKQDFIIAFYDLVVKRLKLS